MTKMKSLSLSLLGMYCLCIVAVSFAQSLDASPKAETSRDITVERLADSSVISIKINAPPSSGHALSDICVAGKVSQSGKIKSLLIRFTADPSFVPSGETAIIISKTEKLTLYSSSIHRIGESGKSGYTLTYLNDLDSILAGSATVSDTTVYMDLFSKNNKADRLGIPLEFFNLLRAPPR
jgi:hypothetical protein